MIAGFVVLLIIALGLGGYIAYAEVSKKMKAACAAEDEAFERARNYIALRATENAERVCVSDTENAQAVAADNIADISGGEAVQNDTELEPSEIRSSVTAQEVDSLISDEVVAALIESSDKTSDKTKMSIVNIDTLSQHFESGETVTLDEIKKRIKGFNKQTTYIKVLARGTLDKALTVEADSFSPQAVKMIVLTGGTAVEKR